MIRFYGEVLGGQREAALISKRSKRAHLEEAQNGKRHSGGKRAFGERGRQPRRGRGRHLADCPGRL